jgi:hypothetical protein
MALYKRFIVDLKIGFPGQLLRGVCYTVSTTFETFQPYTSMDKSVYQLI